jgi:hypothetical protein
MNAFSNVVKKPLLVIRCVDDVRQGVLDDQAGIPVADELDAIHLSELISGLGNHFLVHRDQVPWIKTKSVQPQEDLIQAENGLAPQETQVH